jgi:hypothetical protein
LRIVILGVGIASSAKSRGPYRLRITCARAGYQPLAATLIADDREILPLKIVHDHRETAVHDRLKLPSTIL